MRERDERALLSRSNLSEAYWSIAQMIAHRTINGLQPARGRSAGHGTLSGSGPNATGSFF
jgi:fumarylacetoacetase